MDLITHTARRPKFDAENSTASGPRLVESPIAQVDDGVGIEIVRQFAVVDSGGDEHAHVGTPAVEEPFA